MDEDLRTQDPDPKAAVNSTDIKEPPVEKSPINDPETVEDELIDDDRFQRSNN